jgi:predicted nuclease of predicted toxin-antitoxin system
VKLLLDENLSWRMIKKLSPFFEEVVHASDLKIIQPADDISIWNYAKKNGFTILSKDDDFEKIVLLRKAPPKLIYLKTYNLDTNKLVDLILGNKDKLIQFVQSDENDIFEIYSNLG